MALRDLLLELNDLALREHHGSRIKSDWYSTHKIQNLGVCEVCPGVWNTKDSGDSVFLLEGIAESKRGRGSRNDSPQKRSFPS